MLLNSGPRKPPQPDSNCPTLGESHEGGLEESSVFQGKETPVDHILYRADIPVGDRGDIIQFYNKLFIGFIKDYVLRFSPNESEVGVLMGLGHQVMGLGRQLMGLGYQVMGLGRQLMGLGYQVMGLGRWLMGLGRQLMGLGRQLMGLGRQLMGLGRQLMGLGYQLMGLGRWLMGLGRQLMGLGRQLMGLGRQLSVYSLIFLALHSADSHSFPFPASCHPKDHAFTPTALKTPPDLCIPSQRYHTVLLSCVNQ